MVKPMMNERIRNSIIFHDSLESLHKYVPKEILPKEYDGSCGPYNNHASAQKVLKSISEFEKETQFIKANKLKL